METNIESNKEVKKNKKNKMIIGVIVVLIIIIIGLGVFIFYNKDVILSNSNSNKETGNKTDTTEQSAETNNNNSNSTTDTNTIKELDLTKCLNNSTYLYKNSTDIAGNYGLTMNTNSDMKSVTLNINWQVFGPLSTASSWSSDVESIQITGFTKTIESVFIGDMGQDATGITLFYLMSDNTVEYTKLFKNQTDSQGNIYSEINYSYDYSTDGKITGKHFETKASLPGVNNVIKLYTADVNVPNGSGFRTTIGATKDGSFYDFSSIINN